MPALGSATSGADSATENSVSSSRRSRLAAPSWLIIVRVHTSKAAGGGPALQSTLGGHTPVVVSAIPGAIPLVKAGKLRALAIIGPKRVSALPDVPTLTEAGLPDQETETILPLLAPAGTPKEIVDLLYREIAKIVAMPDVVQKLDGVGMFPVATTPEETSARIKSEIDMWVKVIRDAKIRE